MLKTAFLAFTIICSVIISLPLAELAAGYEDRQFAEPSLDLINKMLWKGQYQAAIDKLWLMQRHDQNNADIYNLLGYSHRKLQRYARAYSYYQQALTLEPLHKGAHEYLGELYIETGRMQQAQQQLQVLERICSKSCKEYRDLQLAMDAELSE
ncbi:MAG: tetratricopeptide repeat protein [Arenicella sp.]